MITKAIIPAAGYGTRFLPATKAQPKEMLPIVDKPIIQYIVEEAVEAGIKDIILVTGQNKQAIENHFDRNFELEYRLKQNNKIKELEEVKAISYLANFIYIRQKGAYGNATPVLNAQHLIDKNESFAVLWGDEFIWATPSRLQQMIEVFGQYQKPVISAIQILQKKDFKRYGMAKIKPIKDNIYQILSIIEKPEPQASPSNLAAHGAYLLDYHIFDYLNQLKPGRNGELWLVDAINAMCQDREVLACEIQNGKYYDAGNKLEYLKANIEFALRRPEFNEELREYLKALNYETSS